MGYDAKGVATVHTYRRPYGVVVRAVPAPESESESEDEKLVCKVRETRLLFEDPRLGPSPCSTDSFKIRTDCHVTGRLSNSGSRDDLEAWLATKSDGKDIPATARDDILRLVFDHPADGVVKIEIWFDVFILGRGRSHEEEEDEIVYWYYDDDVDDEDDDGPICDEAWHAMECVTITGKEEEEEVGCSICLEEKAKVGSVMMRLSCSHVFHVQCISVWMFEHCYCPVCRYKFPIQTYKDYPCVCTMCLYTHAQDPSALPDHPPPYYKFY